jgi:phosphoglucomutase
MFELDVYKRWINTDLEDRDLADELGAIKNDVDAIKDRFYRELAFGTGGLRGVIGAGTNRMNIYTIRRATQAMADYINEMYTSGSVAISFDSRIKSKEFAIEAAKVLAGNGIRTFIYKELMPTPCLSFAVRQLNCQGGIMVTASHNPAKYNGYKAYGEDGCQMTADAADRVMELMGQVDIFRGVKIADFDKAIADGDIYFIEDVVIEEYYKKVLEQQVNEGICKQVDLKVVYTPLNGAGNKPVRAVLDRIGLKNIEVVKEQENPDGNFPTCPFPNPEIKEALQLGLDKCKTSKPDLLLATDPDCDRVGIAVVDKNGEYVLISGNEVGALLFEYICKSRVKKNTMPQNPIVVKTIVSTSIIEQIAKEYGVEVKVVLTGFKYIGEQIGFLEEQGQEDRYVFGFEESYGYLAGSYVRDKDAVVASMLICEMAAFYKSQGISVLDALNNMYKKYGVYNNSGQSHTCEGEQGMNDMAKMMKLLQNKPPKQIGGLKVIEIADYDKSERTSIEDNKKQVIDLPKSDVMEFKLEQNASVIIRPSGTEPKIKFYYSTTGETLELAKNQEEKLATDLKEILGIN